MYIYVTLAPPLSLSLSLSLFLPLLSLSLLQDDMGMTYDELSVFGRLRKIYRCGPYSMFCKLVHMWKEKYTVEQASEYTCTTVIREIFVIKKFSFSTKSRKFLHENSSPVLTYTANIWRALKIDENLNFAYTLFLFYPCRSLKR